MDGLQYQSRTKILRKKYLIKKLDKLHQISTQIELSLPDVYNWSKRWKSLIPGERSIVSIKNLELGGFAAIFFSSASMGYGKWIKLKSYGLLGSSGFFLIKMFISGLRISPLWLSLFFFIFSVSTIYRLRSIQTKTLLFKI